MRKPTLLRLAACLLGAALTAAAQSNSAPHWVATWTSAQQLGRPPARPRPAVDASAASATAPPPAASTAATVPGTPPRPVSDFTDQTVRMIVRTSIGGPRIRVHLSNAFGSAALTIGAAHVALRDHDSAIVASSDHVLLFNGKTTVTIPPGAEMIGDVVNMPVTKLTDLTISVYVSGESGRADIHSLGLHDTYISGEGDFTGASEIASPRITHSWYWVSAIDVDAPAGAAAIVTFGDSITDGATSTPNTDHSWPSLLAQRLQSDPKTARLAVANEGISGNRLLTDGAGVNALARFDRDVLAPAGVKWLMILEGINDIGAGARTGAVTAEMVIGVLRQMAEQAHTHGIKVIGCTLTPYEGAGYASEQGEEIREAVNDWIRTSRVFDSVVDFDKVTRDPDNPKQLLKSYNNTDHLHPNDAGYQAMANAIDPSIFK